MVKHMQAIGPALRVHCPVSPVDEIAGPAGVRSDPLSSDFSYSKLGFPHTPGAPGRHSVSCEMIKYILPIGPALRVYCPVSPGDEIAGPAGVRSDPLPSDFSCCK